MEVSTHTGAFSSEKQTSGSVYRIADGKFVFMPMEDEEAVDSNGCKTVYVLPTTLAWINLSLPGGSRESA